MLHPNNSFVPLKSLGILALLAAAARRKWRFLKVTSSDEMLWSDDIAQFESERSNNKANPVLFIFDNSARTNCIVSGRCFVVL